MELCRIDKKKGFTLIEVLLSGVIVSLVAIFVYSIFASGISVWKKGNQSRSYQRNLRMFSEKLTRELRNTFGLSSIAFEGTEDLIIFVTLIENISDQGKLYSEVGRVSYFVNDDDVFCRQEETYAESFNPEEEGVYEELVSGVSEVTFSYCYLDNLTGSYEWKEDWVKEEQDTIPQAIKIELLFTKRAEREEEINQGRGVAGRVEASQFNKTIFIPIGTGRQSKEL